MLRKHERSHVGCRSGSKTGGIRCPEVRNTKNTFLDQLTEFRAVVTSALWSNQDILIVPLSPYASTRGKHRLSAIDTLGHGAGLDAPNENLVIRLWDTVENTFGGLLHPWQIRRTGRARSAARHEEALALAQMERDVEDMRAGRKVFTTDWRLGESSNFSTESFAPEMPDFAAFTSSVQRDLLVR